jgi:hypothetical protein
MGLAEFDFVKQLGVSHESYHSDDYSTENFVFFLPPAGRADMTLFYTFNSQHWSSVSVILTNQCTRLSLEA